MVKLIQRFLFLLVLSSALASFVVEQLNIFYENDAVCLSDCDVEKKDSNETKKLGDDDKFRPEFFFAVDAVAISDTDMVIGFAASTDVLHPSNSLSILTPPPERA